MLGVADPENIKDKIVASGVNVRTQNIDLTREKSAANLRNQSRVIPAAEQDFAVALLGVMHQLDHGGETAGAFFEVGGKKFTKEADVTGDLRGRESTEIALGHLVEV